MPPLFDSISDKTVVAMEDMRWIASRVESLNQDELQIDPKDVTLSRLTC